jgi:hypothetical protein
MKPAAKRLKRPPILLAQTQLQYTWSNIAVLAAQ